MKEPEHRAEPAFNKARDIQAAWRAQQTAALTAEQRRTYVRATREAEKAVNAKTKELEQRKAADIQERTQKLLLEKPQLQFTPPGKGLTINEVLARRAIEKVLTGAMPANEIVKDVIQKTQRQAQGEIAHEHGREIEDFRHQKRQELDAMLRNFEHARQNPGNRPQDFARANARDRARTSFERAGRDDPASEARKPVYSPALAKAIEKAREQEQAQIDRGNEQEMDDGRNRK